jgi:hypothetical protein
MSAKPDSYEQRRVSGKMGKVRTQSSKEAEQEDVQKYKQLYSMAEAAFKDEDNRYNRIEDTAHKYVPVMIFLVTAESYLAKWVLDRLLPPKGLLDALGLLFIALAFATLIIGALLLFRSFRFEDVRLFRPDRDDIAFFDGYDLATIYRAYADRFNVEREVNAQITNKKANFRHWSYLMMFASFVFLALTGLSYVIQIWCSKSATSNDSWIFLMLDGF